MVDSVPAGERRAYTIAYVVNHAAFFVSHRLPLALEAMRRGHRVELLTGQAGSASMESPAEKVLALHGIAHRRVPFTSAGVNPLRELRGLLQLTTLLRRTRPEIVHCASPKGILYGALAARLAGVAGLVLAVSGMGFAFTTAQRQSAARSVIAAIYRRLARLAYGHPNKRVVVQNRDDERLVLDGRLAGRSELVLISGSGVDLRRHSGAVVENKAPIVLFPARMLMDKGVLEFVDAVRIIRRSAPGWRFVMAGAADYMNPSSVPRRRIEEFQEEGLIEWLGHVEDMSPLYGQASIVCLPSYREGMPKALLEAAASGCAVVTTDTTGCREAVIPGITGDLVPVRDGAALAHALLSLIHDSGRRESYGHAGQQLARERFGVEAVVNRTMDLYEELLRHG